MEYDEDLFEKEDIDELLAGDEIDDFEAGFMMGYNDLNE